MLPDQHDTGIVLLAAGASSRMGTAKQQLLYKEKTFLQHSVAIALESQAAPVVVVLGAHAAELVPLIKNEPVTYVVNHHWQEGMGSSVGAGLQTLLAMAPQMTAVIFMVVDQPMVHANLLNLLMDTRAATGKGIIAAAYEDTMGVPALFSATYFPQLLALPGDAGARKLFRQFEHDLATIPFPGGAADIDTPEDYERLQ